MEGKGRDYVTHLCRNQRQVKLQTSIQYKINDARKYFEALVYRCSLLYLGSSGVRWYDTYRSFRK